MNARRLSLRAGVLALTAILAVGAVAAQEFGRRSRFMRTIPENPPYDGAFMFCRAMFRQNPNGDGGGWSVDYPRADINFPYRLSELTAAGVSRDSKGEYNHAVFQLTDPELFKCPFIMMTEVGALYMDPQEAANLRDYLLR